MFAAVVDVLVKGGPVMIPLGFVSVLAVAISLERLWYFARLRDHADHLMDQLRLLVHEGRLLEAMQLIRRANGPTAAVLAEGLAAWDRPLDEVRARVERVGQEEVAKMEARMAWLDAIVTGAPMLGLLGTVTGIIRSFRILAAMEGVEPSGLSSGIAEALITTAAGLIIAVPVLFIYVYLSGVIDRRVSALNRTAAEFLQLVSEARGRSCPPPVAITRSRRHRPRVEIINMVDVMFFLLAFFMVFTTFRTNPSTLNLDLPRAVTATREAPSEMVVSIDRSGRYFLNGRAVSLAQMSTLVGDSVRRHPDQLVIVRADREVQYDRVVQAIDARRRAGAYRLGRAGQTSGASSP
ncbi:MAG: hypothetical protein GX496_05720 [Firmicutes bacterium]|nr:hypothetical protein [Bacillota bacterium]